MKDYIFKLLIQNGHPRPTKRQLSTYRHIEINHEYKAEYATETEPSLSLHSYGIKRVE